MSKSVFTPHLCSSSVNSLRYWPTPAGLHDESHLSFIFSRFLMFSRIYWAPALFIFPSHWNIAFSRAVALPSELNKWRVSIRRLIQYQSMTNCSKAGQAETHLHKSWLAADWRLFDSISSDWQSQWTLMHFLHSIITFFWRFFFFFLHAHRWNVPQLLSFLYKGSR